MGYSFDEDAFLSRSGDPSSDRFIDQGKLMVVVAVSGRTSTAWIEEE